MFYWGVLCLNQNRGGDKGTIHTWRKRVQQKLEIKPEVTRKLPDCSLEVERGIK